jgi:hypothetical protein
VKRKKALADLLRDQHHGQPARRMRFTHASHLIERMP